MSNAVSPRRSARLMKKRKIDEISADDFTFVFHMPAWVWGSILDSEAAAAATSDAVAEAEAD